MEKEPILNISRETTETPSFIPSVSIRPHHWGMYRVRYALAGKWPVEKIMKEETAIAHEDLKKEDYNGYYHDLHGSTEESIQAFLKKEKDWYTQLRDLPDDAYIHLDIKPDGICLSCNKGDHCSALNYAYGPRTINGEIQDLKQIRGDLEIMGYTLGKDFIEQPTVHTLYNYHGRNLGDTQAITQKTVTFNSLIVRVDAMRDILVLP